MSDSETRRRPVLLVLASTYPRWAGDPEPGFVHELCKRLTERFNVVAVVPDAPGADASGLFEGVAVVRYRYAPRRWQRLVNDGGIAVNLRRSPWKYLLVPGFLLAQYLAAKRIIARRRVDVMHVHWLIPQGMVAYRLARLLGVPYLVTSHGGDLFGLRGRLPTRWKRKVAAGCAGMTVVSHAMREEVQHLQLKPPRIDVAPMGADMQVRFRPDSSVEREADQLLFVGRLVAKKGLPHLLRAMPKILSQRPSVHLTIAGFGPEERALKEQAMQSGFAESIEFIGAVGQDKLPLLYQRAGLLVAPFVRDETGNQEGLPVVLMEAIACGCPVIAGEVAGVRDLFGVGAGDGCVDPADTDRLVSAILDILNDLPAAIERTRLLREALVNRLDWSVVAQQYGDLIEGIACRPGNPG